MNKINYVIKLVTFTLLSAMIFCIAVSTTFAGNGNKNSSKSKQIKLWRQIDESNLQQQKESTVKPEKYIVFQLNQISLQNSLAQMPIENVDAAMRKPLVMEIPMPDGTIQRFRMEETTVLSPELSAQYPTWKTFVGYGIDDTKSNRAF